MTAKYLYRALRLIEIESGNILIPKSTDPFSADPKFGIDMVFPISFGGAENAARQHNWNQNGYPTRGISTSPHYERALYYAQQNRIIAKIDTSKFEVLGITIYKVSDIRHGIAVPEDDEHIIIYDKDGQFPTEIIAEVINLDNIV